MKLVLAAALTLFLLGGVAAGAAVKIEHDREATAAKERKAKAARAAAAERKRKAQEARERRELEADLERIELEGRTDLIKSLERAVKKDARQKVDLGLLDGPILRANCQPLDDSLDDSSTNTGSFDCLAVTEDNADGSSRGYEFSANVNYKDFSYQWGLGSE